MKLENTFGETIRKLREKRKLTLREVAEELSIHTSMLGKIEKNKRKPSNQMIDRLARFYQVDEQDLKIAFLSDTVANQVADEDVAQEVLKVAEQKVQYLRKRKSPN